MSRAVPEWIGKTPDTRVPKRVRLRVIERYGYRCYLSGQKIGQFDKWEVDHVKALINDGENRESNLAPVLTEPHKAKTRLDKKAKSKSYRIRARRAGIDLRRGPPMPGSKRSKWRKKMNGTVELRR